MLQYGMLEGRLVETGPAQPTNPYGYAKDALRQQLSFLKQETPFALTWTRLFYMYGTGQNPKSIYSQLAAAVDREDAILTCRRASRSVTTSLSKRSANS